MKKITLVFVLALVTVFTSQAQEIDLKGALSIGTEVEPGIGIHLGGLYQLQEEIDIAAGFTFFLPDSYQSSGFGGNYEVKSSMWMFDVDGHYIFDLDGFIVYPLAGLNFTTYKVKYEGIGFNDISNTEFGLNIGGGAEYGFSDKLKAFGELKYIISSYDQAVINLGVLYTIVD